MSNCINFELEEENKRLKDNIHDLEMKQVILRKQIEDHIGMLRWGEAELEQKVGAQSARLGEVYKINNDLHKINNDLRKEKDDLRNILEVIYDSRSWKITRPLRAINKFIRGY